VTEQGLREHDALARALEGGRARRDRSYRPVLFDASTPSGRDALLDLVRRPEVTVVDEVREQLDELVRSRAPRHELTGDEVEAATRPLTHGRPLHELGTWAFYPWLSRVVHVLPAPLHRELRLDRNRYKITGDEQQILLGLTVAIAGLSVGRAVVSTLVREGIGGVYRLADLDALSLSNLNRVAGGLADLGLDKVTLAAREIAELDPYLEVQIFPAGVEEASLGAFVDGADVLVDECDDLAMKLRLRERAREQRVPVLMATSDRGTLDIERFDREPSRPCFHGLLGDVDSSVLRGLTTRQKVPYVLRVLEASRLDERTAASLVEVKETLSTWPQLASGVVLGGAMVATAVRRLALGELTTSGRFMVDLEEQVGDGRPALAVPVRGAELARPEPAQVGPPAIELPPPSTDAGPTAAEMRFLVACATLAPSGGNVQPWRFEAQGATLRAFVDPDRARSLLDYGQRATLLALGGALEAARIGAAAISLDARIDVRPRQGPDAPCWELGLSRGSASRDLEGVSLLAARCSNRRSNVGAVLDEGELAALARSGAPLEADVIPAASLPRVGEALALLDRVRFVSPRFRQELFSEIRWTKEEALARRDGIDLASLELAPSDVAIMEVLRSGAGMAFLARLGHGRALGNASRTAFASAAGGLVLRAVASDEAALLEAGRGLLRLWLEATRRGLAVHPWGSPFLFQRLLEAPPSLGSWEQDALAEAAAVFGDAFPLTPDKPTLLVLRIARGEAPTARSVRRPVDDVLMFL